MSATDVTQKKVCMLGDFAVGKTSLVRRLVEGRLDDKYLGSIGVKISRRPLTTPRGVLNLILWDLAGSEEFVGMHTRYLQGAAGGIVVCDLTRVETLNAWRFYCQRLRELNPNVHLVLVANKVDLTDTRAIGDDQLRAAAAGCGSDYLLSSAKTGQSVEDIVQTLAQQLI